MPVRLLAVAANVGLLGCFARARWFSREARIEATYRAGMKDVDGALPRAGDGAGRPGDAKDPAAALGRGMGNALVAMMQGMGGVVCGTVREACTRDFDGATCEAARRRYR